MARQFGGFGGPNMQQLMRQAQKMQEQMQKAQDELDEKVYEASAGGGMVTCKVSGKREILSLTINLFLVEKIFLSAGSVSDISLSW